MNIQAEKRRKRGTADQTTGSLIIGAEKPSRALVEGMINSYESKVKIVHGLIGQAVEKIQSFHGDLTHMIEKLKNIFAQKRSLRRKDFDHMLEAVQVRQARIEKDISRMVVCFYQEEGEMIAIMREIVAGKTPLSLEEFQNLKKKMLGRPKEREQVLSRMLKNFHEEQKELLAGLRILLEKGSSVRLKDLRVLLKAFQIETQEEFKGVDAVLEEFGKVKDEVRAQWNRIMAGDGPVQRNPFLES